MISGLFFTSSRAAILTMIPRDNQTKKDIDVILHNCMGAATILDELTLIRTALRLYLDGHEPTDAVAKAAEALSLSISKL
jgi:hypothetical protein